MSFQSTFDSGYTLSQIPNVLAQQAQLQRLRLVSHRISAGFP